jgi:hypothetical protein
MQLRNIPFFGHFRVPHHSAIQAYPLIALFENLQTLILEIPITLDGTFLTEVQYKNCLEYVPRRLIDQTCRF